MEASQWKPSAASFDTVQAAKRLPTVQQTQGSKLVANSGDIFSTIAPTLEACATLRIPRGLQELAMFDRSARRAADLMAARLQVTRRMMHIPRLYLRSLIP